MMAFKKLRGEQSGFLLPALLTFLIAMGILSGAVLEIVLNNFNVVGRDVTSQQSFDIAEAGINYYLWHLSHNNTDFKDGQSTPLTPDPTFGYGPYVHNYIGDDGNVDGTFTLWIKQQNTGSTIAAVRAIGKANGSSITRTVVAQIGIPSFASYAVASDSALWFGSTESASGPVHSNAGVRMDGSSDSEVSSANTTYTPSNSSGGCSSSNCSHPGVWCDTSVTAPVNCNTRSKNDWIYPVAAVDFNQVSNSLCTMKKVAFNDYTNTKTYATGSNPCSNVPATRTNAYLPQLSSSFSASKGYLIVLKNTTPATYDLYSVSNENDTKTLYSSALTYTSVATAVTLPPSGVIFAEDNVWVLSSGQFNGRLTIASGRLATNNSTNIVIAGPIQYKAKDATNALGLVAENSVFVAPYAPYASSGYASGTWTFEIDAAILAENGEVQYGENGDDSSSGVAPLAYRQATSTCTQGWTSSNQKMLFYGSIATRQLWTWTWDLGTNACGNAVKATTGEAINHYISGIYNNATQYDYNLQYTPPPSYPVTSGYNILSWREALTKP